MNDYEFNQNLPCDSIYSGWILVAALFALLFLI